MLKKLIGKFKNLSDPRVQGRTKHSMPNIMAIIYLATLASASGWKGIHNWATENFSALKTVLNDLTTCPSADTIARVTQIVIPDQMYNILTSMAGDFLRRYLRRKPGRKKASELPDVIALDGKTLTGAVPPGLERSLTHIVNAVLGVITLAVQLVSAKSNEITAIPLVLDLLDKYHLLKGKVITSDAMGCQRGIAAQIIEKGANYLFNLKGNQSGLYNKVKKLFEKGLKKFSKELEARTYTSGPEKKGGQIVTRKITVVHLANKLALEWFPEAIKWAGLKTVIQVEKMISYTNGKPDKMERHYYISSLTLPPKQILEIAIMHWEVETMHKRLDCSLNEDKCKIWKGNSPEILSLFRKLGLNVIVPVIKLLGSSRESVNSMLNLLSGNWEYLMEIQTKDIMELRPPDEVRKMMGQAISRPDLPSKKAA